MVTTKTWSSCTGLSFLGSLVGCIFQSGLWQNVFPCVTFIPLCKIWTTLYLAWKQYSWKHSLRLCHFYSTLFIYNLTFLEENIFLARTSTLVSLSLPIYNHFYLGRKYHSWKSSVVFWENIPACISLFLESVLDARKNCQDYEYVASDPWHQTLVCYGSVNMSCRLVFIFLKQKWFSLDVLLPSTEFEILVICFGSYSYNKEQQRNKEKKLVSTWF